MHKRILAATIAGTLAGLSTLAHADDDTATLATLRAELASLQAKVAALESDQQRQAEAQAAAQAEAARAAAAAPAATDSWTDRTRIGGTMFANLSQRDTSNHGEDVDPSGFGLDVKRFYLTVDHRFNDTWAANLTTDFSYTANDGSTQVFVKKAYLEGRFDPLATFRAGAASMPWVPMVEDWYGYRFVENVMVDRLKFGTSTDWGLHLGGDNGLFNYQASVVNGAGYKNPSVSGSVDIEARVGVQPIEGLILAAGGYSGRLGADSEAQPALHTANRYDAMVGWKRGGLRVGAEWFRASNWKNVATATTDSASGWSAWASQDFGPVAVFARYDRAKTSRDLDPALTDTYWNAGVAFPITKGVRLALAYKDGRQSNGSTIDLRSREIGAWGEVKF